jgi:hypothetical protein
MVIVLISGFTMIHAITVETQDERVLKARKPRNLQYVKITGIPVIDPENCFCNICQVHVAPLTKHCKACNKCVALYDRIITLK